MVNILFRCDFGLSCGFGHLMRCVSLVQAFLKYNNINLNIFSRGYLDSVENLFGSNQINFVQLPETEAGLAFDPKTYLSDTTGLITIFDNYDVSEQQMRNYKENYPNVVAIDDLADRTFNSDIIINQNIGSIKLEYNTTSSSKLFLGPKYALLRKNILSAKRRKEKNHIFVSFGGGEIYNRIKRFLKVLISVSDNLNEDIVFDFVISGNSESKQKIFNLFKLNNRIKINFIENKLDLSQYMCKADFAITAAGSTIFELAYLGIPQIVFIIDKNQEINGFEINDLGLGKCLGYLLDTNQKEFEETFISFLHNSNMKNRMSKIGQSLVDGQGSKRIAHEILNYYGYA